jgi:hypothetical protein
MAQECRFWNRRVIPQELRHTNSWRHLVKTNQVLNYIQNAVGFAIDLVILTRIGCRFLRTYLLKQDC